MVKLIRIYIVKDLLIHDLIWQVHGEKTLEIKVFTKFSDKVGFGIFNLY